MKNIISILIILLFVFSCTRFKDDVKEQIQNVNTVTPNTLNTKLKVANIKVDQEEFDFMYTNYNDDIEIEGTVSFYKGGELIIDNEAVELQIKGVFSSAFPLKTLGLKFEDTFDNEDNILINPDLLSSHSVEKVKAIRFRNSGNDFEKTMLKDISYTKLAKDANLNLDLMYVEQVVVFVNDVFYGLMNMRTEVNTNGVSRLYGVKKKTVTLAKITEGGVVEKKDGDLDRIDRFVNAIDNSNYDYLISEIDESNFIDYMIYESYIGNRDWPKNNVRFFAIEDGPFRFSLFDLDLVGTQNIDKSPSFFINNPINNPITELFNVLYANQDFRAKYNARYKELVSSGVFSSDKFNTIVIEYQNNIEHIIPLHLKKYNTPETVTEWYLNIEELKYNFKQREEFIN
ncbi:MULTISPECIES: CotH kinase family protein [unclassified Cellulophaga]|uniref:CotH kinase family protein n=1 Tax=unclassified Cellulophaga TaxID=2634405 RepID=UPI0026E37A4E|nr:MULTISPECIES: CotH kinase family protein [unclassified Cellulophaga]MDO6490081.1 CotH kinase family protein [Cellulophaga sp. 2_MG-2023]MDO6494725.1 CotH kinase family protein [Cellulophaga sp. 3_MG-2023]